MMAVQITGNPAKKQRRCQLARRATLLYGFGIIKPPPHPRQPIAIASLIATIHRDGRPWMKGINAAGQRPNLTCRRAPPASVPMPRAGGRFAMAGLAGHPPMPAVGRSLMGARRRDRRRYFDAPCMKRCAVIGQSSAFPV